MSPTFRRAIALLCVTVLWGLAACGESSDRDRNVRTVVGTDCKSAGQTKKFSRVEHVCGSQSGRLSWFIVAARGKSSRCTKPGALRVTAKATEVCAVVGKSKLWFTVTAATLPNSTQPPASIGESGSAVPAGGPTSSSNTPAASTTIPVPPSATATTVLVPNAEVAKSSAELSSPTKASILIMPKAVKSDVVVDPAPVVQLVDEAGNPRGRAGIPVTIVVDRPDVVVVGGEARTDADGRAVFDGLEFSGAAAPMSVLFSPQGFGSVASDVDLQAGPAAAVSLLTAPTTVMAGASWDPQPIVALIDEAGNVVSGPGTTIEARIAGGETLETVQIDKNGYATFKLTAGPVAGTYDFEFVTRGGIQSAKSTVTIIPESAKRLVIDTVLPTVMTNGEPIAETVEVKVTDRFGNPVKTRDSTIELSVVRNIAEGEETDTGTAEVINGVARTDSNGVARFVKPTIVGAVGNWELNFADNDDSMRPARFDAQLAAGPADALEVVLEPDGARSGLALALQPAFRLVDKSGNVVNPGAETISATVGDEHAISGATANFGEDGVARFNKLTIEGPAGPVEVSFVHPLLPLVKRTINLTPGVVAALAVTAHEQSAVAGQTFSTDSMVEVRDASGNVTSEPVTVLGQCDSMADWIGVPAVKGIATFKNLSVRSSGNRTCKYQTSVGEGWVRAITTVRVVAASASTVEILSEPPTSAAMGVATSSGARVKVVDEFGNAVEQSDITVRAGATGTGLVVGVGGIAKTDVMGVAQFPSFTFEGIAGTYRLEFTPEGGLGAKAAADTDIRAGEPVRLVSQRELGNIASGSTTQVAPSVVMVDNWDNRVDATEWATTLLLSPPKGVELPSIVGGSVKGNRMGVFEFGELKVTGMAGTYTPNYEATNGLRELPLRAGPAFELGAGEAVQFTVTRTPNVASGAALGVVTQFDAMGNQVSGAGVKAVSVTYRSNTGTSWSRQVQANTTATNGETTVGLRVYGVSGAKGRLTFSVGELVVTDSFEIVLATDAAVGDPGPSGGALLVVSSQSPRFIETSSQQDAFSQVNIGNDMTFLKQMNIEGATGWILPTAAHTDIMRTLFNRGVPNIFLGHAGLIVGDTGSLSYGPCTVWIPPNINKLRTFCSGYQWVIAVRSFG